MAYSHRIQSIRIDLLSGKINSDLFHIDRNNILVKMCIENLHRMLSGIRMTPDIIKEAYLDIYFDIPSNTITEKTVDQIRCKFEVKFIHSDGRQFIGEIKDDVIIQP